MSYELKFEIKGLPRMTNRTRVHWSKTLRHANEWKKLVYMAVMKAGRPPLPLQRARLVLTRCSTQTPDPDGLVSGFKHVIDGLTVAGVLADDKFTNIGMPEYRWEPAKIRQGKVRVEVYGCP